jgi:hypothetical protein
MKTLKKIQLIPLMMMKKMIILKNIKKNLIRKAIPNQLEKIDIIMNQLVIIIFMKELFLIEKIE